MASAGSLRRTVEDLFALRGKSGEDRQLCAAFVKRRRRLPARNEFSDPVASQRNEGIFF
jgi:hypothetical protein